MPRRDPSSKPQRGAVKPSLEVVVRLARRITPEVRRAHVRRLARLAQLPAGEAEVLATLLGGPLTALEVAEELGWPQARAARDLRSLLEARLVRRDVGEARTTPSGATIHPHVWSIR